MNRDMQLTQRLTNLGLGLIPIILALLVTTLILLLVGAPPGEAYGNILAGAFESPDKWASVVTATVPLLLCSAGLLITFAAGLWNIGVEGQIVAGALLTSWLALNLTLPPILFIPLLLVAGLAGGALWGLLAGWLKVYGGVHEIFGGVGLNFIATVLTNYLIFGPWKPADGATMSGTDPFPQAAWLPRLGELPVHPIAVVLALVAIVLVYFALRGTTWGLKLKAIGNNQRSAFLMGIPTRRYMLVAFLVCGALAGMAGSIQAIGVRQRLIPSISAGYGFLALLVVLLTGYRPLWVLPVALFFAIVGVGSPRLELSMQLDSALGGTLEGLIVLFVLLAQGVRRRA
ncbi:MAG: ABC transporter permease [Anaerolineae bacterium]